MKIWLKVIVPAILASGIPALAQKDFLTSDEVEKVREAQEPNERLKLYILFARQRLDQLQRLLQKDKKGRSLIARELLEDYTSIIDTIDTVSDDSLKRGADNSLGANAVREAEHRFLTQLQTIKDRPPADLDMYNTALTEALAATSDSLDLSQEDPTSRAAKLNDEDKKQKAEAEKVIAAEDSKGNPPAANAKPAADAKPARKPPTLLRPGETPDKEGDVSTTK
jgi:hypothetical protein